MLFKLRILRLKIICWFNRRMDLNKISSRYDKEYADGMSNAWKIWKGDIELTLNESIKQFVGKTVLEIGCGKGEAIEIITKQGFKASGCEISKECVEACKEKGLDVWLQDFNRKEFTKKFDTVYSSNVVEHLVKDAEAINRMLDIAKFKAVNVLPYCSYVPEHLHYYLGKDIIELCEKICFNRTDIDSYSIKFLKQIHLQSFIITFTKIKEVEKK
jgi:SAM-dependent methyltransferase